MRRRVRQVEELLKVELGNIFIRGLEFPHGAFQNIIKVKASKDLKYALVWVGVFPPEKRDEVLKYLNKNVYYIQQIINKRFQMKIVPKITFKIDRLSDKVAEVDEALEKIKKEQNEGSRI